MLVVEAVIYKITAANQQFITDLLQIYQEFRPDSLQRPVEIQFSRDIGAGILNWTRGLGITIRTIDIKGPGIDTCRRLHQTAGPVG